MRLRYLSIPMLGDSFCKEQTANDPELGYDAFNPHAWGLFLQAS